MTATVFRRKRTGPATHALIIGVGHYPNLPGGSGKKKFPNPEGMRQLASPPASARAIARWLIERYECPARPLASVALLTSEKSPKPFAHASSGRNGNGPKPSKVPVAATMDAVEQAILEWRDHGNENPDHLLLFYFCGHGLAAGTERALLMADFGAKPHAPFDGALDFRRFHSNMEECAARHQCYFVDACRVGSELLGRNAGYAGNPVVQWTGTGTNPNGMLRLGPILYSTLADAKAYAQAGKASVFADALLESLEGAGSADEDGPWQVRTTVLQRAVQQLMLHASQTLRIPQAQIPAGEGGFVDFPLNTVETPRVPVFVRVEPQTMHPLATLRCEGGSMKERRRPDETIWRLSVPAGKYSIFAEFTNGTRKATPYIDEPVRPPYWAKPLRVQP